MLSFKYPEIAISPLQPALSTECFSCHWKTKKMYFLNLQIADRKFAVKAVCKSTVLKVFAEILSVALNFFFLLSFCLKSLTSAPKAATVKELAQHYRDPSTARLQEMHFHKLFATVSRQINLFLATGAGYGLLKFEITAVYTLSVFILPISFPFVVSYLNWPISRNQLKISEMAQVVNIFFFIFIFKVI